MYAVAGVSGQTGAATARALLAQKLPLRVIVRDAKKGKVWADKGAEVAIADIDNANALAAALNGATSAYLLNPPAYGAENPFDIAERRADVFARAILGSDVARVVVLSSISAHLPAGNGIIRTNHILEKRLGDLAKPATFLRPGYFFENWGHVLAPARTDGVLPGMLSPLTKAVPMVCVADIGALAARLMQETWIGRRIVELAGPTNTSPETAAAAIAAALGTDVKALAVPREAWAGIFAGGGMSPRTIEAFIEMFDGFNNGTIRFEGGEPRRGATTMATAAKALVADHL
ncbi:NmrA family NAD(P)-binding protein [Rhizobium leguminosarum]|uniref:NmrA family NAD(P)-binding protein n=1 Tax=Rhizobium leguminosarum TaxID=384 RepID=UPI0024A8FCFB|nr:NmrA family NAD(P)-binding protein [Rhizobium leguminosarum]MDI5929176.1 NmrA family NAD(P)-binding protein [Rhizobium leguminosarum]